MALHENTQQQQQQSCAPFGAAVAGYVHVRPQTAGTYLDDFSIQT